MKHILSLRAFLLPALAATWCPTLLAQEPLPTRDLAFEYDTGLVQNDGIRHEVVASFTILVEDAPWLRVFFDEVQLPPISKARGGSYLRITSHGDGGVQELDPFHIREWSRSSAYFNGNAVQVEIVAAPRSGAHRLRIRSIAAGIAGGVQESQCGPVDDRQPSTDVRVCRTEPIGCTGWLIDDCAHCLLTAGHCNGSSAQIAEFNCPAVSPGGSRLHPGPDDQYSIDASSKQTESAGIGSDWGYFGVFANPNTGMTPVEAQGAFFTLAAAAPPPSGGAMIRITGHGTDSTPIENNQIQQTHVGPYFSMSGETVTYQTDTTGGNSGSPVIYESTGEAVGVHTHGGCSTGGSGANSGTAIHDAALQNALANPLGVCSQAGIVSSYCSGKTNALGCVPFLVTDGCPSASDPAPFQISARSVLDGQVAVYLYGFEKANLNFHGGKLCLKSPFTRLFPVKTAISTGGFPCPGVTNRNFNNAIQSGNDPMLTTGQTVNVQVRLRDATDPAGFGDSLTNAVSFVIGP
jgi:V8-like Glu-specific endopeptidase